ncbi:MAG: carboxypeptidase regulatory-like domain-containing protein [Planctomycetes bacterium]|nr:carboxypeptidase regulatory-like domain-containing protein [Planctomycetota bacterium]
MKRAWQLAIGLLLGVVIGYLLGNEPERTPPPPKPVAAVIPPREPQNDVNVASLEREVAALREALAAKAATPAGSQAPAAPGEAITGSLLVKMLDADGKPVEGAWIGLHSGDYSSGRSEVTRRTGPEGTVRFPALLPEEWRVTGSHQGLSCTETVEVVAGETTEITLAVSRGGAVVEGTVREKESRPVTGASVTLSAFSRSSERRYTAQTDGEGRYRFEGVHAGRYFLSVGLGPPGAVSFVQREIVVPEDGTVSKDLVGGVDGLFGTVRDAVSGAPLAGVRVSVQSRSKDARTDERGEYRLTDLMRT